MICAGSAYYRNRRMDILGVYAQVTGALATMSRDRVPLFPKLCELRSNEYVASWLKWHRKG